MKSSVWIGRILIFYCTLLFFVCSTLFCSLRRKSSLGFYRQAISNVVGKKSKIGSRKNVLSLGEMYKFLTKKIHSKEICICSTRENNDRVCHLAKNEAVLVSNVCTKLAHVHGINVLVSRYLSAIACGNQNFIKGTHYELERAIELHNDGVYVCGLGLRVYHDHIVREFDIFTDMAWIECKNVNWQILINSALFFSNFENQLMAQKNLVDTYNRYYSQKQKIRYQVSSKNPIPYCVKQLFTYHDIDSYES
jgi:hypothetical protein